MLKVLISQNDCLLERQAEIRSIVEIYKGAERFIKFMEVVGKVTKWIAGVLLAASSIVFFFRKI